MKKILSVFTLLILLVSTVPGFAQDEGEFNDSKVPIGEPALAENGIYIVQMVDSPVVAYEGGINGLRATAPRDGQKIDPFSTNVVNYVEYLTERHNDALSRAGGGRKVYDYIYSFNGFAAELTFAQANNIAKAEDVLAVTADELQTMTTSSTPTFLGLTEPGGLWDQLGGVGSAGEDVIIGIVDSGIWPESLSFSDRTGTNGNASKDGKLSYLQVPTWHGMCTPGEEFTAAQCNQKLIGAQHFNAAWGGDAAVEEERPWEFMSARDYNGHGTHTASTAGGNYGVLTTGRAAGFGSISGMAPRARISAYKTLWSTEDGSTASGYSSDMVAGIDQAVADGVDVINYSITGSRTNFLDPVQVAFLFAARAGVFVAAAAANTGPTPATVNHPGPWLTTVAAGTHNRNGEGSVTLGNGTTYFGASFASQVGPAPLIDSTAAGLPGANATQAALCYSTLDTTEGEPVLDPAKVAGKIVVCDRGTTGRVNKSLAVQEAGGVGMILLNTSPASINADFHYVPTVHLQSTYYAAVHAYAATPDPTATINQSTTVYTTPAPFTASFSSRGPLLAGGGDLLKPDMIAPGVDILAAEAPPANQGMDFNLKSGTSMATPHVAGLAALLKDLYPSWSPMAIKSALMTTGYDVLDGANTNPTVIFSQGAGHVRPNRAMDPGLVYNSGYNDWLAFLCGTTTGVAPATCTTLAGLGYSFDPSNMNVASIAIGDLLSSQTVTRKVTNVGGSPATYSASVSGMTGINVTINPSTLTLNPGQSAAFTVGFAVGTAPLSAYTGGQLTWSDGVHNVRIPLVVRPIALRAPTSVSGNGGPISYDVAFGYTGPFSAAARGLIPAAITAGSVEQDPDQTFDPAVPTGTVAIPVTIAAGTTYARFSLFDADVAPGSDIDLYVYRGSTQVGSSGSSTSAEEVNLLNPTAGDYTVYVHGWGLTASPSPFKLHTWLLGSADAGNMTISAPASAVSGATGTITLTFSGLAPATRYLGSVAYSGVSGMPNPTIVNVNTP